MAKRKTVMEFCDNPECEYECEVDAQEPSAPGYHLGKGHWNLGGGGPIPATYACSEECITPAVLANIERDMNNYNREVNGR